MRITFTATMILLYIVSTAQSYRYTLDTLPSPRLNEKYCECLYNNFDGSSASFIDNFLFCINRKSFGDKQENFVRYWTSSRPETDSSYFKLKLIEIGTMLNVFNYPVKGAHIYEISWKLEKNGEAEAHMVIKSFESHVVTPKNPLNTFLDAIEKREFPLLNIKSFSIKLLDEYRLNVIQLIKGGTTITYDYSILDLLDENKKSDFVHNYLSLGRYIENQLATSLYLPIDNF